MLRLIKSALYKLQIHRYLARKRFGRISKLLNGELESNKELNILEVGCHNGRDFVSFLSNKPNIKITGIDLVDHGIDQSNFVYCDADAESIPFADNYFDIVVSIGVLEHIAPIEKLSQVIKEIDRVAKKHVIIVPSITTFIEPHTASFLWQLRQQSTKSKYSDNLNFMSDDAWLSFAGFSQSSIRRFWLIPLLISNTYIYRV